MSGDLERAEGSPTRWLAGSDVMVERILSNHWIDTSLGAIETWPQSLRTALGICLGTAGPCCIAWGPQRLQLYNNQYAQLCETREGNLLGRDFAQGWPDAWPSMRQHFDHAFAGEPTLLENQRVSVEWHSGRQEALMSFSFVPVRDESGGVGGVLVSLLDASASNLRLELERANEELEQYSYTLAHDFRSPLRTLEAMARMVVTEHSLQLPADAKGLLDHVVRGASKLADRIDALLRVAQLGRQPLARGRVDVGALVADVVRELRRAAPQRHIEVLVGDLPEADGDPELLRLALSNILSNAFKFTRKVEHARIEVNGRRQDAQNVYCIKDNGAGFEMKYANKLFGLFQRMHAEAEFEGIGVGLTLARRLMERHGGTVWAEARKGEGATFYLALPA